MDENDASLKSEEVSDDDDTIQLKRRKREEGEIERINQGNIRDTSTTQQWRAENWREKDENSDRWDSAFQTNKHTFMSKSMWFGRFKSKKVKKKAESKVVIFL